MVTRRCSRSGLPAAAFSWVVLAGCGAPLIAAADEGSGHAVPSVSRNPLTRDADAVLAGRELYLERCAVCHGQDAQGSMAANLVRSRSVVQAADAALFRLLVQGIPGTQMPAQDDWDETQVWQVVAYLHNLARPGLQPPVDGDPEAGREVFAGAGCGACHTVDGSGGFWGPALDSVAARKKSAEIREDVLDPDARVAEGYQSVVVLTEGEERVEGLLKNADTFSLQVLRKDGAFSFVPRSQVTDLQRGPSAMPSGYGERLTDAELRDLLAFLDRQREPFIPVERGFRNY